MTFVPSLQVLLVLSLTPQLVLGSPKQYFLKQILEPPPCRSKPENCLSFCTLQEECPGDLQCCSAYCGIVCASNKFQDNKKIKQKRPRRRYVDH
ncbi:WAP four-disulfide core domain protein 13 [Perognathus longimembris pacificus]|uniref:WAP four-disulfide core domain protein 13 n=1 Tax=Perognathus longimembris pacificus TaxID=214514 RepID=UPI0020188169|nr:WAP four-disulfide core domain protein 13 [Perognathus longimembris pacificus]